MMIRTMLPILVVAVSMPFSFGFAEVLGPEVTTRAFVDALCRADLPALMNELADDATMFAPMHDAPGLIEGRTAILSVVAPIFEHLKQAGEGPVYMNLVPRELKTQVMGDTAIVTFHLGEIPVEPLTQPYSFSRRTFVLRVTNGEWKIVHLHASNVLIPSENEAND